jgi:rhodanese-related sulfurtransferase
VAQQLINKGFTNVSALLGGFAAWQRAGFAVETAGGTPVP